MHAKASIRTAMRRRPGRLRVTADMSDVLAVIEEEERRRREEMSCPNATVSPVQDQIHAAIFEHDNRNGDSFA